MSTRSFESSASSKDSNADCLKVHLGEVFWLLHLTDRQNYDIEKRLEGGGSPGIYLATCKRGRLKSRTVVLKKVLCLMNLSKHVMVNMALHHH